VGVDNAYNFEVSETGVKKMYLMVTSLATPNGQLPRRQVKYLSFLF
jgi:hypothetical protein